MIRPWSQRRRAPGHRRRRVLSDSSVIRRRTTGTPLSERTGLCFVLFCCVTESKFGRKHIRPNWSTLVGGSIWPPGALREASAWRKLSDPIPPSTPCSGADWGTTSSCGKDSSFSTAVTGNLMGPEMSYSRATPSGSTSLCVSETTLVLHALDHVK